MDWENHLEKNPIQKIEKTVKNQSEIAACEQKTTTEKTNFCSNTIFALYFKIRAKKNPRRKTTRFFAPFPVSAWPKSQLQFDFKNHKNVWTILKKNIAGRIPETTQVKNHLNAIQLLIKQNVPSLIYDYLETKSWNKKVKTIKSNLLKNDKKSDPILL